MIHDLYSSEEEALAGHKETVQLIVNKEIQ
jgi:hypothetical protein